MRYFEKTSGDLAQGYMIVKPAIEKVLNSRTPRELGLAKGVLRDVSTFSGGLIPPKGAFEYGKLLGRTRDASKSVTSNLRELDKHTTG